MNCLNILVITCILQIPTTSTLESNGVIRGLAGVGKDRRINALISTTALPTTQQQNLSKTTLKNNTHQNSDIINFTTVTSLKNNDVMNVTSVTPLINHGVINFFTVTPIKNNDVTNFSIVTSSTKYNKINVTATTPSKYKEVINSTTGTSSTIGNFRTITSCEKETVYLPWNGSFLNYLLHVSTCDVMNGTRTRLDKICKERKYALTVYYKVAYLTFCNEDLYRSVCRNKGLNAKIKMQYEISESKIIENKDRQLEEKRKQFFSENEKYLIQNACNSVDDFITALQNHEIYKNNNMNVSGYKDIGEALKPTNDTIPVVEFSEWYIPIIPFCQAFTCGISKDSYNKQPITAYDCMPKECRGFVIFSIIFDSTLAVITILANSLVLGVAARTKIMRNIPGYFKISLAIADLVVGVFVLPACIFMTYTMYIGPLPFRSPGQQPKLTDYMSRPLANFIGFVIVLSFAASIYSMAVASIDRYLAITKPFKYRQGAYLTKRRCGLAFAAIWFIGFIVAIFPVFVNGPYSVSAFNLVLSVGMKSAIVYAVALFVPLVAVWSLNGAMLKQVCADGEKRKSIRAVSVLVRSASQKSDLNPVPEPRLENIEDEVNDADRDNTQTSEVAEDVKEEGFHAQKRIVTRNQSSSSIGYHKNEKRTSGTVGEGIIGRMRRNRNRLPNSPSQRSSFRQPCLTTSAASVERRLARTLAVMIGAFTIALMPNIATLIAYAALSSDSSTSTRLVSTLYIASRILLSNSFWNCIIYSIRNQHFRRAMFAIFLCKQDKIDKRLRYSLTMSQWKRRSAVESSSGSSSMRDKQALSKTSSTSSSGLSYRNSDNRRGTAVWSLSSNSPCASRKSSTGILDNRPNVSRCVSYDEQVKKPGILKNKIDRCESAPVPNKFSIPTVIVDPIDENNEATER